ncbi:MAG: hypothetical protein KDD61_05375 [Bdellovibrionales bacterium]|nr:hypothetical protein [Bdellovibrionales bacterium]
MRILGRIFVFIYIGLTALAVQANDCIPQSDMTEIARDFRQFRDLAGDQFCPDGSHRSNLLVGIYFMRKTSFEPNMDKSQDDLFSGRFASDWYSYFKDRINDIVIDTSCPKGVGAYVRGWGSKTMWVCTMLLTEQFVGLDRASVFMHEARHIDGFPHTTCQSGARSGIRGACDRRISDGGSYAVSVETYAQLARYATNIHPALKAYSKSSAVVYADEAFVYPAEVDRSRQYVLLSKSKDLYALNMNMRSSLQKLGQVEDLGHIVMRSQQMILFPDDKAKKAHYISLNNEGEIPQKPRRAAGDYNDSNPQQRALLKDLHIGGQWSAKAYEGKVTMTCDPRTEASSDVSISGERPTTFVYPNGYNRADFEALLLVESGAIYKVGCQSKRPYVSKTAEQLDQKYKRLYKVDGVVLGLTDAGELFEIQGTQSQKLSTAIDGQIHDLAPMESFEFFDR